MVNIDEKYDKGSVDNLLYKTVKGFKVSHRLHMTKIWLISPTARL